MEFLFNTEPPVLTENNISRGSRTGFSENFGAAFDEQLAINSSISQGLNYQDAIAERNAVIKEFTGMDAEEWANKNDIPHAVLISGRSKTFDKHVRPKLPKEAWGKLNSGDRLKMRANEIALEKLHAAQKIMGRADGVSADLGNISGSVTGPILDPVNIATMALNPAGGILKMMATEAAIGILSEGLIQIGVQSYREELGLDYGFDKGLSNALIAGAGAGLLRSGVEGIKFGVGKASIAVKKKLLKDFEANIKNPTDEQIGAKNALKADILKDEVLPENATAKDREDFEKKLDETRARFENDDFEPNFESNKNGTEPEGFDPYGVLFDEDNANKDIKIEAAFEQEASSIFEGVSKPALKNTDLAKEFDYKLRSIPVISGETLKGYHNKLAIKGGDVDPQLQKGIVSLNDDVIDLVAEGKLYGTYAGLLGAIVPHDDLQLPIAKELINRNFNSFGEAFDFIKISYVKTFSKQNNSRSVNIGKLANDIDNFEQITNDLADYQSPQTIKDKKEVNALEKELRQIAADSDQDISFVDESGQVLQNLNDFLARSKKEDDFLDQLDACGVS